MIGMIEGERERKKKMLSVSLFEEDVE